MGELMIETSGAMPPSPLEDEPIYACKGCGQILEEGKAFELAGHRWHIDCFRCNTCGTLLDSDANLLLLGDGSLICNNCTYSCSACGNKIEDLAILTGDQAFCASCFRCRNCKRKIENLRYARTSQGIFCMTCHESLMARRRKKSRAAKQAAAGASSSHDRSLAEKSLPALPPEEPLRSGLALSSDGDTPVLEGFRGAGGADPTSRPRNAKMRRDDMKRDISPASIDSHKGTSRRGEQGASTANSASDNLTLPASTYKESRRSHDSQRSETEPAASADDGLFVPIALDTGSTTGPSPVPRSRKFDNGTAPARTDSEKRAERDFFSGRVPAALPHREMLKEGGMDSRSSSQERRQKSSANASPHIAYQERGRNASHDTFTSTQKRTDSGRRESPASRTEQRRDTSAHRQLSSSKSNADFKLQDAPKSRKAVERKGSKADISISTLGSPTVETPVLTPDTLTASPSLTESTSTIGESFSRQASTSSRPSDISQPVERPKREDSLPGPTIKRKEVAAAPNVETPTTPTGFVHRRQASSSSIQAVHGTPAGLLQLNGGKTISTPVASPQSRSILDAPEPPLRSANRPGPPDALQQDHFTAPRTAPVPPERQRGESVSTHSDVSGNPISPMGPFSPVGTLPRYSAGGDFSMEEDMARIMRGEEVEKEGSSVLRKMSNAVKHGRSFSDRGSRGSTPKYRGPANGSMEISSPTAASPGRDADPILMQNQLRRAQQRIAELEAEKISLQEVINSSADIKQVNTELQEKRSTMTFLDTQREMVVRELEIMTDHLKKAKDSNQPINIANIQSVIIRDFAESMQKLKDALGSQIEELMQKRNSLTSDISDLIQMKDKGFQELESLQKENKELIRMNAGLKQMAQQEAVRQANGSIDGGRPPNGLGLGIYTRHHKDKSELSMESRALTATEHPMTHLLTDQDSEPSVLPAPQVVNIRKAKPNMWRKGGTAIAKNIKTAFAKANQGQERPGFEREGGLQGIGYANLQSGKEPILASPMEIGGPMNVSKGTVNLWAVQKGSQSKLGKLGNHSATDLTGAEPSVLFGSDLTARVGFEKQRVPRIVQKCIQEVQLRGMTVEGIYRKSGGSGQVNAVRDGFQKDVEYDISDEDLDIHAITSALKQYFRRLPNPLITYEVYDALLEAGQIPEVEKRAPQMREAISELPKAHYDCLEFLVFHLTRVMDKQSVNLMTPLNLAVVFAPTIMRPQSIEREMSDMQAQRIAVQSLLEQSKLIFERATS